MTKKIYPVCLTIFLLFVSIAGAQEFYGSMDYININYSETGGYDADFHAMRYRLGFQPMRYFSLEAFFGVNIGNDTVMVAGYPVIVKLDDIYGFYIHGIIPIEDKIKLYGIYGVTHAKLSASVFGYDFSVSESDNTIGAGIDIKLVDQFYFNLEYLKAIDTIDYDYSGLSIGFKIYF